MGNVSGKDVVQIYYEPAQGKLAKPVRNLIRFAKTQELQPKETQKLSLEFGIEEMASFDDSGVTGHRNSYVLEAGEYKIYAGSDVRETKEIFTVTIKETCAVEQLQEACAPVEHFERMVLLVNADGTVVETKEAVPTRAVDLVKRIVDNRPENVGYTGDMGYRFKDVMMGTVSKEEYLAQLTDEDLICMARGEGMCSSKVTPGIAGSLV